MWLEKLDIPVQKRQPSIHALCFRLVFMKSQQLTSYVIVNDCVLSPNIEKKAKMLALTTYFQHCTGYFSQYNKARKINNGHINLKK